MDHAGDCCPIDLCRLPAGASTAERERRLVLLRGWLDGKRRERIRTAGGGGGGGGGPSLPLPLPLPQDPSSGCPPLHWAAGTGFDEAISLLLGPAAGGISTPNQRASNPSAGRTPLHYASRNGHLGACRLLIEAYGAHPNLGCDRGGVTPLQLAVWQNRPDVVRYLLRAIGERAADGTAADGTAADGTAALEGPAERAEREAVHSANGHGCGLQHWVGLVPRHRWENEEEKDGGDEMEGGGVLPLARYLHERYGISYGSEPSNANSAGHTPLHKAAWGGNPALCRYYRRVHGIADDTPDRTGAYAADAAEMKGHTKLARWLRGAEGSGARRRSLEVLGLLRPGQDVRSEEMVTDDAIRRRYLDLARERHPDRQGGSGAGVDGVRGFVRIQEAYEHLTLDGGRGRQCNPKFERVMRIDRGEVRKGEGAVIHDGDDDGDDLFAARLLAVISDYGQVGFPVSRIVRRWDQVWPDRPFPTPDRYVITVDRRRRGGGGKDEDNPATVRIVKRVKLLRWLKWRCRGVVRFEHEHERGSAGGRVLAFAVEGG